MTGARAWAALALLAAAVAAGCGDDGAEDRSRGAIARDQANAAVAITVGSKNFTEQRVLGEVYAQGLRAAGFRVDTALDLGDEQTARRALDRGVIDGYPEYTGTVLVALCDVATRDVPRAPGAAYERARDCLREDGPVALPPTPFQSTNEVGVRRETAERLRLRTISDLRRVDQRLTLFGSPECPRRRDCLRGLREVYGLDFARFQAVPIAERHRVLARGERVASIVFSTDPQIPRQDIVVLRDDRRMLPPANSTFVISPSLERRAGPAVRRVVAQVQKGLTETAMRELNARVDLDGRTPAQAARQYLRDARLVG
jgi:osmoprotectant transport system substrate-binding protein